MRQYIPPDPKCPMCDRPVDSIIYQKHSTDPVISTVVYLHDGENHFVIYEPDHGEENWKLTSRLRVQPP